MVTEMGDLSRWEEIPRDDGMEIKNRGYFRVYRDIMVTGKSMNAFRTRKAAIKSRFYTRNKIRWTIN